MITDMARKHPSNPQENQDYLDVLARFERLKVEAEAKHDYDLLAKIKQILKSLKVNNPKPKVIRSEAPLYSIIYKIDSKQEFAV